MKVKGKKEKRTKESGRPKWVNKAEEERENGDSDAILARAAAVLHYSTALPHCVVSSS